MKEHIFGQLRCPWDQHVNMTVVGLLRRAKASKKTAAESSRNYYLAINRNSGVIHLNDFSVIYELDMRVSWETSAVL